MQETNLSEIRAGLAGRPFNSFIQHHLKRQDDRERERALQGTMGLIPKWFVPATADLADDVNHAMLGSDFWHQDTAAVFDLVADDARDRAARIGQSIDDEIVFNIFQIVSLNIASMASQHRQLRTFAGIKKGWFS